MPPTRQVAMSEDWVAFAHFANSMLRSLSHGLHRIASAFSSIIEALRKACLWIYHLPGRILTALKHAISISVTALLFVLKLMGWIIAIGLVLMALFYASRLGVHLWRAYRRRLYQSPAEFQHQDLAARARRLLAEEQTRRAQQQHAAWERGRKRRQRKAAKQAAREQTRAQTAHHETLRREALRAQQQAEDARLYHRWRKACDETFHHPTTTTSLPLPPPIPCTEPDCRSYETTRTCTHRMRRLLLGAARRESLKSALASERLRWHPETGLTSSRCGNVMSRMLPSSLRKFSRSLRIFWWIYEAGIVPFFFLKEINK